MTVVFFSDIPWDGLRQRPQHLASRLARIAPVLWVEPATLGRKYFLSPQAQAPGVARVTLPAFPLNARNRWIRRAAGALSRSSAARRALAALQRALLTRALRRMGGEGNDLVCLVENFLFMHIAQALRARRVVFDYIDDAFGFTAFPPFVRKEWMAAVGRADAVTVTSPTLRTRVEAARTAEIRLIPNGAEAALFAPRADARRPDDLPRDGRPIAGYAGSVYPWLDFALLEAAAEALEDFHLVMIGQSHPDVADALARLARRGNVHYLGPKPYGEVPGYVACFDAGIIPFRRTLLTEAVNPVKLYEYAAAGVPIVATDFSDDTRAFAELVLIARSAEEFARHVRAAAARKSDPAFRQALFAFARANDWDSRAGEFSALLQLPDGTP